MVVTGPGALGEWGPVALRRVAANDEIERRDFSVLSERYGESRLKNGS